MGGTDYPRGLERGHATFKCDHCGTQKLAFRPTKKKWKLHRLLAEIRVWVQAQIAADRWRVTAEEIAAHFQAQIGMVRHCLHFLNLEGLVGRRVNRIPHDCRRATSWWDRGNDNSWAASIYYIQSKS